MTAPLQGLLLFAHGARDPRWARPFEALKQRLEARAPARRIALSFLELMAPTLPEAGARLAADGCTRVEIVPLFLGTGGHVRRDLPLLVEQLRAAHPQVEWILRTPVGELDAVIDAIADAALNPPGDAVRRNRPE